MTTITPPSSAGAKAARLTERFKHLVHEGNVRRVTVRRGEKTYVELPVTVAVVGAVFAPALAAAGALTAVLTHCDIGVERTDAEDSRPPEATSEAPTAQSQSEALVQSTDG